MTPNENTRKDNLLSNNRKLLASAANNKNRQPSLNSNRSNNAYQDAAYSVKITKKEITSLEANSENSVLSKLNYFGNRNQRKSEMQFNNYMNKEKSDSLLRQSTNNSKKSTMELKNSPNDDKPLELGANKLELEIRRSKKKLEMIALKRPDNPGLDRKPKPSPARVETEQPESLEPISDVRKPKKQSLESSRIPARSLEEDETIEAVPDSDIPQLNNLKKLSSFESFDRKEEEKLAKVTEQKLPIDGSKYLKPSSAKNPKSVNLNEKIIKEREDLIKYTKTYIEKNNELPPTTLDYYEFVKCIGKGAFGKVTLGIHKLTGKYVAIKTIDKVLIKDEFSKRKIFQEVYILKKIRHSNIIRLLEVFESNKHYLMVMEFAGGGDLLHFIKRRGRMQESDAKFIFKQIAYGLAHIHCRSVIHRDIKLDNILLDCESGVKICDFGVSKIIKKGQVIKEQCGTPAYIAPEIITDIGYEGFFVDIWSLGKLESAL